jgi:hypothetical protein
MGGNNMTGDNKDKVLLQEINQPIKLSFENMNQAAIETIKNSPLYMNAASVVGEEEHGTRLLLASPVTTNGWDTVSICRVTALNERIKGEKTYPQNIAEINGSIKLEGDFDAWQVITGGDGRNVKLHLPMKSGLYTGMDFGSGDKFDLKGVSVDIYVKLNYFPVPDPKTAKDGSYNLYVNKEQESASDPIAAVISFQDPSGKIDSINVSILRGLFESWLNRPENLQKFDTLFSTVIINNMGEQSEEYKWLKATSISYAYTDKGTEESSIFGVLCMTNNRPHAGLPNQLPAIALKEDDNAIFLISREVFVEYQFLPSLPYIFPESKEAQFILDQKTKTTVTAKNLKLDSVKVGAITYYPVAESFDICFNETYILTKAYIRTPISPGIETTTIIETKQTLVLGVNKNGEQVMTYQMVGEPIVENTNHIAAWIVVTEVILALIAVVVTAVAGVVAGKIVALVVGIIVAIIVALVSIVIHVIIEKCIAGGVTDEIPAIAPMVRVATKQVKWPFAREDAFVLTDINYLGAVIFEGNLKLLENYTLSNGRLVYACG